MQEIQITLNDAIKTAANEPCAHVTIVNCKGVKQSRYVTMESVVRAFRKSIVKEVKYHEIGEIPFGYYDAWIGELNGTFCADMVAVLPPGRQMICYQQSMYDVCLPRIVFRIEVRSEKVQNTQVFLTKDEKLSGNSILYRFPFGNVSMDGFVCWGQNKLPPIKFLKDLEEVMLLFIQSPTNDDYYNGKDYVGHPGLAQRQLLEFLKDQETYPDEYLVESRYYRRTRLLKDLLSWKEYQN